MIRVFGQTDTVFTSNGDCVLQPLKAQVHKKDNGDYYLDLETNLEYVNVLTERRIIVANTPTGDQAFRINNVTKTKHKVSCRCPHVFYDTKNYLILDSYVVDKDCDDALNHLNDATDRTSEFTVSSDVDTIRSYRCVRKTLYEAIQTVLERWGGHLVRDNFDIKIKSSIGTDNGVNVQYGKNLKDISCVEDWSSVVTKLLPVGKDGLLLDSFYSTDPPYLELLTPMDYFYIKTVSFNQNDIKPEDYESESDYQDALEFNLFEQGLIYLNANKVPKVNYTLKANLDLISDIGDTIRVWDDRIGVDLLTNVISFTYDCIAEKYTDVEFGNFKKSAQGIGNALNKTMEKTTQGILGNRQLIFNADGTVTWIDSE